MRGTRRVVMPEVSAIQTVQLPAIEKKITGLWRGITTSYLGDTIHVWAVMEAKARQGEVIYPPEGYPIRDLYMPLFEGSTLPLRSQPHTTIYLDADIPWRGPETNKHIRDTFVRLMHAEKAAPVKYLPIKTDRVRGNYVVLCPYASTTKKEWEAAHWVEIASNLLFKGYKVYVNQNPDRSRYPFPERVEYIYPDLVSLARLLQDAAAVVCVDSGHLHLSDAMGNPPVGLYGTTGAVTYGPYNDRRFVIDHHALRWNHKLPYNSAKYNGLASLNAITVEEVLIQINRRLAEA